MQKNFIKYFILSLVLKSGLVFGNCNESLKDYYAWALKKEGGYDFEISYVLSIVRHESHAMGFSEGTLSFSKKGALLSKDGRLYYSDRDWCPNNTGPFCVPYQKFDYRKAESFSLLLKPDMSLLIQIQKENGKEEHSVQVQCNNGFLYGHFQSEEGLSFLTMALKKERKDHHL